MNAQPSSAEGAKGNILPITVHWCQGPQVLSNGTDQRHPSGQCSAQLSSKWPTFHQNTSFILLRFSLSSLSRKHSRKQAPRRGAVVVVVVVLTTSKGIYKGKRCCVVVVLLLCCCCCCCVVVVLLLKTGYNDRSAVLSILCLLVIISPDHPLSFNRGGHRTA